MRNEEYNEILEALEYNLEEGNNLFM